jgi:hypothetical protein
MLREMDEPQIIEIKAKCPYSGQFPVEKLCKQLEKCALSVDYGKERDVSAKKSPKKARVANRPKTRLRVDKDIFDGVLDRLIQSKPEKRS